MKDGHPQEPGRYSIHCSNAFVIFETLNDRGLDLATSDLLKNFLFLTADDRINEVQKHWVGMYAVLEGVAMESASVDYIRHLWSSIHGATREAQLYDNIKKAVDNKQAAVDLAQELEDQAKLYVAIQNPEHAYWKPLGPTTQGHIETVNLLRMIPDQASAASHHVQVRTGRGEDRVAPYGLLGRAFPDRWRTGRRNA